ncbi:MAG: gamma carbonic anhydrase family protein [Alphaproteobacteria bacterium]|nr:gamma carbonic anhydrase family protein [Alphaproteobacteria bacterium]
MSGLILPFERFLPKIGADAFIAPDATIIGNVEIGAESNIWYKCAFRGDVHEIRIGQRCNLQDGTIIHVTDGKFGTYVGDECNVGHLVLLHGCILEPGSFVGMRASILDGAVVESGAMLAAGSLLTPGKRIPKGELWAGSPARFFRKLDDSDYANFRRVSAHYVELARRHRASLAAGGLHRAVAG